MDTLNHYEIEAISKPTATKIEANKSNLMRNEGFTTNGYWMLRTDLEPKFLQAIPENGEKPLITRTIERSNVQTDTIEAVNELRFENVLMIKMGNEKHTTWVNVAFLSLFASLDGLIEFYQNSELDPIVVKRNTEIVGILMPLRVK